MTHLKGDKQTISVTVNGIEQRGSFAEIEDFNWNPEDTIDEVDLMGADATAYEIQHNGYKGDFTLFKTDSAAIRYYQALITQLQAGNKPVVNITAITTLGGGEFETLVFLDVVLKLDDQRGSRKSFIKNKFSFSCSKMQNF
jgi:hypothetical protein